MMKVEINCAQVGEHEESIEQVKERFALWRATRKNGAHLSPALWTAAVGLAQRQGLEWTARELHVDYARLKKRLEHHAGPACAGKRDIDFVEILSPPIVSTASSVDCIVLMENARGGKMRVELKNLDGLAALSCAFWNAQ